MLMLTSRIRKAGLMLILVILHLPAHTFAQGAEAPVIVTGHPDRPPFVYRDGDHVVGFVVDIAGIIFSRLEIPYQSRFIGPWKRVQEFACSGRVDLIAGLYRTLRREIHLDFSDAILLDPTSVFVARGREFAVSDPRDLADRRGVTLFGDSFGEQMDRSIECSLRMIKVYSPQEMFDHLLQGKADYVLFGYYSGMVTMRRLRLEKRIVVARKALVAENLHLAFCRQSPHAHLLPRINREIRRLRQEGVIDALLDEYMRRYFPTEK